MNDEKESTSVLDGLLFPKVFKTFRMAIQPSKMLIALGALAVICLVGWLMDFSNTVVIRSDGATELDAYVGDVPDSFEAFVRANREYGERTGVFSTLWHFNRRRFHGALYSLFEVNLAGVAENAVDCCRALVWAFRYHFLYCIVFFVMKLAVISLAGGAICRIAALQFARDEKPGVGEALRYGVNKFVSFFAAPLVPIAIIIFVGVFVFVLGLLGNIPWFGELLMGIFVPLALLAGALITALVIGAVAGFDLMFPAVAYDGSDALDAMSRAFSYVYSRPWRMGFYTGLAAVYGAICYVFVRLFAFLLLIAAYTLLAVGVFGAAEGGDKVARIWIKPTFLSLAGPGPASPANWSETIAAYLIYLCVLVVVGLVIAFITSFYFSANTIIYALMRKWVDNTSVEDIYTFPEQPQTEQPPVEQPAGTESEADEPPPDETQDS
jgi:hypothetical protein